MIGSWSLTLDLLFGFLGSANDGGLDAGRATNWLCGTTKCIQPNERRRCPSAVLTRICPSTSRIFRTEGRNWIGVEQAALNTIRLRSAQPRVGVMVVRRTSAVEPEAPYPDDPRLRPSRNDSQPNLGETRTVLRRAGRVGRADGRVDAGLDGRAGE